MIRPWCVQEHPPPHDSVYCTEACALRSPSLLRGTALISHVVFVTWGPRLCFSLYTIFTNLGGGVSLFSQRGAQQNISTCPLRSLPAAASELFSYHQQEDVRYLELSLQTCSQVRFIIRCKCKERDGCERTLLQAHYQTQCFSR